MSYWTSCWTISGRASGRPLVVRMLVIFFDGIHDTARLASIRWACLRRGHSLLCTVDGHLCTRCGTHWVTSIGRR